MLTESEVKTVRDKLISSNRPLIFFDDDADGVSSFLQFYKATGDGKGVCVKGKPMLEPLYVKKVDEFSPDTIFILDKPMVDQEFLDNVNQEVIWLDHHPVQNNKKVKYFNPRIHDDSDNSPTSYWAYQITKNDIQNSLWIAMIGIVGDWNILLADEFRKEYPDLLPKGVNKPEEALFTTKLGELVKIVNWNLKGSTTDVNKSIKVMTRITSPYEILDQQSPQGKYLYKKYKKVEEQYQRILSQVKDTEDNFLIFRYEDSKLAFSSEISNELLFRYPNKIIIVARDVGESTRLSIRTKKYKIPNKLNSALKHTSGYGGGHDNACGASILKTEYDVFIDEFKKQFKF